MKSVGFETLPGPQIWTKAQTLAGSLDDRQLNEGEQHSFSLLSNGVFCEILSLYRTQSQNFGEHVVLAWSVRLNPNFALSAILVNFKSWEARQHFDLFLVASSVDEVKSVWKFCLCFFFLFCLYA